MMNQDYSTPAAVRAHNLSFTINLIRERGTITRAELNQITHLSTTTISALVNVLIASGFVTEAGIGVSSGGRRPVVLEFNYNARYTLGVDMGATHITVIIMKLNGQVIARKNRNVDVIHQPYLSLDSILEMIASILDERHLTYEDLLGVALTVPAPLIDEQTGEFLTYYMPAWAGILPVNYLRQTINLPIYVENDANSASLAEKYWGIGRGYDNLAYIKLGTGVGAGLIIDNEIYRGVNGNAGEIGHTTIEASGRLCRCGNHGCIESYVGIPGLLRDVREGLRNDPNWQSNLDALKIDQIIDAANNGNEVCTQVIAKAGKYMGIGIANLVNLFNPGLVVIGGELTAAGDLFLNSVLSSIRERSIPFGIHREKLVLGELGSDAVAVGAATLVMLNAFNEVNLYQTLGKK
jgi:glucokinase-like ROK family protein